MGCSMAKVELVILGRNWIHRRRVIILAGIDIFLLILLFVLLIIRTQM